MALRSLGATLLAKTNPGTALRKVEEDAKQGAVPASNVSAQPGSVARKTVDQPLEVSVPGGTEKQVAVKPQVQPNLSMPNAAQPAAIGSQGLVPQMGGAAQAAMAGRNINSNPAPASAPGNNNVSSPSVKSPNVSQPLISPVGLRSATTASTGGGTARTAIKSTQPMLDMVGVGSKNAPAETNTYNPVSVPFSIGGRVSAAEDQPNKVEVGRSLPQGAAATIANVIDKGLVNAISNIGKTNYQPTSQVSKSLMNFANNPQAAVSSGIQKNVQKVVQQAPTVLRSVAQQASNTASKAVQKATSFLRSLFGK